MGYFFCGVAKSAQLSMYHVSHPSKACIVQIFTRRRRQDKNSINKKRFSSFSSWQSFEFFASQGTFEQESVFDANFVTVHLNSNMIETTATPTVRLRKSAKTHPLFILDSVGASSSCTVIIEANNRSGAAEFWHR